MDLNRKVDRGEYTDTEMPEYPARVLFSHCMMKGVQLGSVVGVFVTTPVMKATGKLPMEVTFRSAMPGSLFGGVALSLALLGGKVYQGALDVAGVDDRAYRIVKNKGQVAADRASVLGMMSGAAVGAIKGRFSPLTIVAYSCGGVTAGLGAYLLIKLYKPEIIQDS